MVGRKKNIISASLELDGGELTNVRVFQCRSEIGKHEFGELVTSRDVFFHNDVPFCRVTLFGPILVGIRVGGVKYYAVEWDHLTVKQGVI